MVFNGCHKTVPIKRHQSLCPEFAVRTALSLSDRAGVGIVEGDDAVIYVPFSGKFLNGLFFWNIQQIIQIHGFLFPSVQNLKRSDFHLKNFKGGG
ncbi:hypothetical protein QUF90_04600 [Desulfococcaceae bacterium HSG9]|nr:hypothetical protein [Desulfococcaceae bacterium HSG9]